MAKLSVDEILDAIKELSIIEAADLSKKIEEEFGIQAAAPMAVGMMAAAGAPGAAEEEAEEQTEFDVVLQSAGEKKIQVIKEVRALTSLGLEEAKDLVDSAPTSSDNGPQEADAPVPPAGVGVRAEVTGCLSSGPGGGGPCSCVVQCGSAGSSRRCWGWASWACSRHTAPPLRR